MTPEALLIAARRLYADRFGNYTAFGALVAAAMGDAVALDQAYSLLVQKGGHLVSAVAAERGRQGVYELFDRAIREADSVESAKGATMRGTAG